MAKGRSKKVEIEIVFAKETEQGLFEDIYNYLNTIQFFDNQDNVTNNESNSN